MEDAQHKYKNKNTTVTIKEEPKSDSASSDESVHVVEYKTSCSNSRSKGLGKRRRKASQSRKETAKKSSRSSCNKKKPTKGKPQRGRRKGPKYNSGYYSSGSDCAASAEPTASADDGVVSEGSGEGDVGHGPNKYEIAAIIDKKIVGKELSSGAKVKYKCEWVPVKGKHFPPSWVDEDGLVGCEDVIREFNHDHRVDQTNKERERAKRRNPQILLHESLLAEWKKNNDQQDCPTRVYNQLWEQAGVELASGRSRSSRRRTQI